MKIENQGIALPLAARGCRLHFVDCPVVLLLRIFSSVRGTQSSFSVDNEIGVESDRPLDFSDADWNEYVTLNQVT